LFPPLPLAALALLLYTTKDATTLVIVLRMSEVKVDVGERGLVEGRENWGEESKAEYWVVEVEEGLE
jgi:hypothetical protein